MALSGTDCLAQRAYDVRSLPVTLTMTAPSEACDSAVAETDAKADVPFVAI